MGRSSALVKCYSKRGWAWRIGVLTLVVWYAFFSLPSKLFQQPTATVVYDDKGNLLGGHIAEDEQWRFPAGDSISEKYKICAIAFEDAWFYYHPGVNPVSVFRALVQNIKAGKVVSGASTISMQVIRLSRGNPPRTVLEKIYELILATRLELTYSKREIFALYANNAPFGGNTVGLQAASYRYYGRNSFALTWAEAATLAVLPNAPGLIRPGKRSDALRRKRNFLLKKLLSEEKISQETYTLALLESMPYEPYPLPTSAVHLVQMAHKMQKGLQVSTTINQTWQSRANQALANYKNKLAGNGVHNAAALLVEVETGAVKAYVGNQPQLAAKHGPYNDMLQTPRSSGSILKPFLYASMLHGGKLLPQELVSDVPVSIAGFVPENYIPKFDGVVPADEALYRSLNIPAVLQLQDFGVVRFKNELQALGISTLTQKADYYGLSLILGGAEVTAYNLAEAYSKMAQKLGSYTTTGMEQDEEFPSIHWLQHDTTEKQPCFLSRGSIHHTFKALKKVNRPESEMGWQFFNQKQVAWKTGTSFGFRDAWAVGVTQKYVCVVWVGNADGEGRPGLVGAEAAAPILFEILSYTGSTADFAIPYNDMYEVEICATSGLQASNTCPKSKQLFIPKSNKSSTRICNYHQVYYTIKHGAYRANKNCTEHVLKPDTFMVLSPKQAWFYTKENAAYRKLPPWFSGCNPNAGIEMEVVYPQNNGVYYLPKDLSGETHKLIAEIAVLNAKQTLFWQMDGKSLGVTEEFHQLPLSVPTGKHTLTVTDASGNSVQSSFEVLERD